MKLLSWAVGFILVTGMTLGITAASHAQDRFSLSTNDVVVFAGGTNMVHLQQAGHLEAMLTREFALARPKFRDLSWEADTVFHQGTVIERWRKDGFGTLNDQLKRVGATVVIAQFGQIESMSGPEGLDEFANAYERLIEAFEHQAKLVVLVTPTPFDRPPSTLIPDLSRHNADLALYVDAIKSIASKRKLALVDLFTGAKRALTDNGMHVADKAQVYVAREIARQLGIQVPTTEDLEPLRQAVVEKHRLWYDYWRPANWKLLYGDDGERQFTRGGKNYIPFKDEWRRLLPLIAKAEQRVWQIARGGEDPGGGRPDPEVLHGAAGADIKMELESFTVMDGMQINLFASEHEGLTSPLAIRWDPSGRMYVTVTTTYPHVFPGDLPNDKIIVLEDTDGDGSADKSTVFVEGLNIPTGLELGDGGVYVGQNTELLFLQDTDGDGKADQRRVVLGGLGNGDSHQTCNSFIWSPGGELYFGQGDGIESRVETPWGASNLFQAGFYRFRPRRLQLHPLLDDFMGPGNPWGVAFDEWGQIFSIDGAGGVTYLSPGQIPTTHKLRLRTIGEPGGYCGIGYLDGRNLPESLRGDFVVGDYKSNRVKRFSVNSDGAGFSLQWKDPVLQSRHRNFRPVDVKMGPDGAIYVVDWYNPITCHQDDAYRDPTRDKAHGRIWRISAKTPPGKSNSVKPSNLTTASIDTVLNAFKSPEHWTRYQAKRVLTQRDTVSTAQALSRWAESLDPQHPDYEHHLYEAVGAYETIEVVEPILLSRLLRAKDARARAYAVRVVGRWHDRLDNPLDLIAERINDEHPQVRMEAVMACAAIPSPRSITVAARVIDMPTDRWIDYALTQAAHHLKPNWSPAFERGEISFDRPNHLATVLNKAGGRDVLGSLKEIVKSDDLTRQSQSAAIGAILAVGGPDEWRQYGLDRKYFSRSGQYDVASHAEALTRLVEVTQLKKIRPEGDLAVSLNQLIDQADTKLKTQSLTLAGIWKVTDTQSHVLTAAKDNSLPTTVRAAAFAAMTAMKLPPSGDILSRFAKKPHAAELRAAAIQSLVNVDAQAAAQYAVKLFGEADLETLNPASTLVAFLNRQNAAEALAGEIQAGKMISMTAELVLRALYSTGRSNESLIAVLNQTIGVSGQVPDFNEEFVKQLVTDASNKGAAERGAALFNTAACITCHKIDRAGAVIGPDLTAIGTTLSAERIVEELLWPNRQIKEGYSVVRVLTEDGVIHQGYERKTKQSQESGDLVMRELATEKLTTIPRNRIEEQQVVGSPMPVGLTALLTRPQMLDLIRYLSELGRSK